MDKNQHCVFSYPTKKLPNALQLGDYKPIVRDLSAAVDEGTATAADGTVASASSPKYRLSSDDPDNGGEEFKSRCGGGVVIPSKMGGGGVMPSNRGGTGEDIVAAVGDSPVKSSGGNGDAIRGGGEVGSGGG